MLPHFLGITRWERCGRRVFVHRTAFVCDPYAGLQCRTPRSLPALLAAREEYDAYVETATETVTLNAVHVQLMGGPNIRKAHNGIIRTNIVGNVARIYYTSEDFWAIIYSTAHYFRALESQRCPPSARYE